MLVFVTFLLAQKSNQKRAAGNDIQPIPGERFDVALVNSGEEHLFLVPIHF